jgi:hypothetical protein
MDKVEKLQARIAADPFDAASWEQLVGERMEAKRRNPEHLAELRTTYDDLLKVFPTAVSGLGPCEPCHAQVTTTSQGMPTSRVRILVQS